MKRLTKFIILLIFIVCASNNVFAQSKLNIYTPDSTLVIEDVDTIYYGFSSDSLWSQYVVTFDSTYTFPVAYIDNMTYKGPFVTSIGVIHGAPTSGDSLLVATLAEITGVSDSSFSVTSYASSQKQLIVVADLDTVPIMLFRGHVNDSQSVVIDSFSTVMALIMSYPSLSGRADTNYPLFVSEAMQTDSFNVLCNYVGQSIAAKRALYDTLNNPMYIALANVIAQLENFDELSALQAKSSYNMGNGHMLIETNGSVVQMSMRGLSPCYMGTVRDANGNIINGFLRIPSRADFGVMDIFWNQTFNGEVVEFDMLQGGNGSKYFDLSCRSWQAQLDFYLSAFILPAFNFIGVPVNGCTRQFITDIAQSVATSQIDNVLRSGSAHPNDYNYLESAWNGTIDIIKSFLDLSYDPNDNNVDLTNKCIQSSGLANFVKSLNIFTKIYNAGKMALNTSLRCYHFYHLAPDSISFCLEYYGGSSSTHQCTTPELICSSGNGQQGNPDSLLNEPIVLKINARDKDGNRQERIFDLHIMVTSGQGWVSDTIFSITTSPYFDVQCQFNWRLGSDSTQQQRVSVWLTDPTANNDTVSSVSINAFFYQESERIDSFKVAANRYVTFSSGNLQYQPSTDIWRFSEHQYDMIGNDNLNISDSDTTTYTGWIDLFSWSTAFNPTFAPTNNSFYDNGYSTFFDWGVNPISNGGEQANMWRTPTMGEWYYLFNHRPNADSLYSYATVCNIHGMILLPDNWVRPDSSNFIARQHNWTSNVYDSVQWSVMEESGAIFLPAAGFRYKPTNSSSLIIHQLGNAGAYWSSMGHIYYPTYGYTPSQHAYRMDFFGSTEIAPRPSLSVECYYGQSVRLIRNL